MRSIPWKIGLSLGGLAILATLFIDTTNWRYEIIVMIFGLAMLYLTKMPQEENRP